MTRKIIDTHLHIWDLEKVTYDWLKNDTSVLNRSYLPAELSPYLCEANVVKTVLVQSDNNLEDTSLMLKTADQYGFISGVVAWLPLEDPGATERILTTQYLKNPYFKGVRHLMHLEADAKWLLKNTVLESLQLLALHQVPYDLIGIHPDHIKTAMEVAEKIPTLKMVFDHLNQPPIAGKERFGVWGERMKQAACYPNLHAKISGLTTASGNFNGRCKRDIKPYIEFVLNQFGAHRCFCGGDWPVSLLAGTYVDTWQAYADIIGELVEPPEQELILSENASNFYQL